MGLILEFKISEYTVWKLATYKRYILASFDGNFKPHFISKYQHRHHIEVNIIIVITLK